MSMSCNQHAHTFSEYSQCGTLLTILSILLHLCNPCLMIFKKRTQNQRYINGLSLQNRITKRSSVCLKPLTILNILHKSNIHNMTNNGYIERAYSVSWLTFVYTACDANESYTGFKAEYDKNTGFCTRHHACNEHFDSHQMK